MQRRILAVAVLASFAFTISSAPSGAATKSASKAKVAPGVVFGDVTKTGYGVVIELSKTGRKVVTAAIGLELVCGMPPNINLPDGFKDIAISKAGKFSSSLPVTRIPADPSTGQPAIDVSASIKGQLNKAKTSIAGTWQRRVVIYDPTDPTGVAVYDTCDSGAVKFRAKQ
ncbi:MAG TPA: hypothetical protein VGF63_11185 [Solirubrobacteraceae bacterium]|jgi:hypothetical protein